MINAIKTNNPVGYPTGLFVFGERSLYPEIKNNHLHTILNHQNYQN